MIHHATNRTQSGSSSSRTATPATSMTTANTLPAPSYHGGGIDDDIGGQFARVVLSDDTQAVGGVIAPPPNSTTMVDLKIGRRSSTIAPSLPSFPSTNDVVVAAAAETADTERPPPSDDPLVIFPPAVSRLKLFWLRLDARRVECGGGGPLPLRPPDVPSLEDDEDEGLDDVDEEENDVRRIATIGTRGGLGGKRDRTFTFAGVTASAKSHAASSAPRGRRRHRYLSSRRLIVRRPSPPVFVAPITTTPETHDDAVMFRIGNIAMTAKTASPYSTPPPPRRRRFEY